MPDVPKPVDIAKCIQDKAENRELLRCTCEHVAYRIDLCVHRKAKCEFLAAQAKDSRHREQFLYRAGLADLAILKWRAKASRYRAEMSRLDFDIMKLKGAAI